MQNRYEAFLGTGIVNCWDWQLLLFPVQPAERQTTTRRHSMTGFSGNPGRILGQVDRAPSGGPLAKRPGGGMALCAIMMKYHWTFRTLNTGGGSSALRLVHPDFPDNICRRLGGSFGLMTGATALYRF